MMSGGRAAVTRLGPGALRGPLAVLYQSIGAPVIDGARKPVKEGGYSDSGADIAYILREAGVPVATPSREPDPRRDLDWVFPDDDQGIAAALSAGARILWANTVLFEGHPVERVMDRVGVVGQLPARVQRFDDKWSTNALLRGDGLPVANAILVSDKPRSGALALDLVTESRLAESGLAFPLVVKPVRGRGSQGVSKLDSLPELREKAGLLLSATVKVGTEHFPAFGSCVIVEDYLSGEEVTLTVMPPGTYGRGGRPHGMAGHWALPAVRRFNHHDGIAPYNGVVAVVSNSEVVSDGENETLDFRRLASACEKAAALVGALAPIRIDCRRSRDGGFSLFDLNMKPNMTGPGRPGRDDQDSLTSLAARAIGWSYRDLLAAMLGQAWRAV